MATVTGDSTTPTTVTSCPTKDPVPYDRIILDVEDRPDMKKDLEVATDLLDYVLCRVPDPEDAKYKDDEVRTITRSVFSMRWFSLGQKWSEILYNKS